MKEEIKVYVVKYADRANLVMRYLDPLTNKHVTRSTRTTKKKEAAKVAAKWESELQEGRYQKKSGMTWDEFIDLYDTHILTGMPSTTAGCYQATINVFTREAKPKRLSDLTSQRITAFVTRLREQGRAMQTIARHLRTLKLILNWGKAEGYLHKVPTIRIPKHKKEAKGRAITVEEFERMLVATPKIVGELAADSYRFYLRGLLASGLRLTESLLLRWDDKPGAIVVELGRLHPMLLVPGDGDKRGKNRVLPMAPEFAQMLAAVPEDERSGKVFRFLGKDGNPVVSSRHNIGPNLTDIGKKAGVVVKLTDKKGELVKKFASAHDLRRAFGFKWSRKVMPAVLKELMRHESIDTTMKYYVGLNAEATAAELWAAVGNTLGNTQPIKETEESENPLF